MSISKTEFDWKNATPEEKKREAERIKLALDNTVDLPVMDPETQDRISFKLRRHGLLYIAAGGDPSKVLEHLKRQEMALYHAATNDTRLAAYTTLQETTKEEAQQRIGFILPDEDSDFKIEILDEDGIENLPDFDYMIDGLIAEDSIGVVFGPPGSGKSFIMASLAVHVADGRPWLEHTVKGAPVVYMTGGEGRTGWKDRIQALKKDMGISKTAHGFHMIPHSLDLRDRGTVDHLIEAIRPINPGWIIVDTLARHMAGGDDNSSKDMGQIMENCNRIKEETGASVTVVHHPVKSDEEEERGSGSLRGFVDYSICVKRYAGTGNILLKSIKDKYAEAFKPFRLMLQTVELENGPTPVVATADPVDGNDPAEQAMTDRQKQFYDALKDYPESTMGEIIASTSLARGTAYKARDYLLERGVIKEDTETKRLAVVSPFET